jgi:ketosteroid isomerase-like protein
MSQKNVEIVRQGLEAWERGDLSEVIRDFDESVVTRPIIGPEWHGPQGVLEMAADWVEGFDEFTMIGEEFIDAGDAVVVRIRQEGRGASTGVPVQVTFWFVYSLKDAKVIRFEMFQDRDQALQAVGLSNQDARLPTQNVDKLRAMQEAFNRGDFDDAVQYAHPEVELYPGLSGPDTGRQYRGRDELRQFLETISDVWETQTIDPVETIEIASDRVLVVERWLRRVRQGIEFDIELAGVYTFRDGLIVRIDGFRNKAEAIKAVGLSEQGAHADST